jgi:hypothetical protein
MCLEGASDALVASETAIGLALITTPIAILAVLLAWMAELSLWRVLGVWIVSSLLPGALVMAWWELRE